VRTPARVLIADDNPANVDILQTRLAVHGYEILTATDGEEALALAREKHPDLILLDVMMPKLDGFEVCRRLKADASLPFMPVVLVTARAESKDVVTGLEAGADEYLTKPVDQPALVARVQSMLRTKALHDQTQEQAQRLEAQATELGQWNATLERRVQEQVGQLERLGRLKRFFSPQLAERIVAGGAEDPLKPHRRDITAVFVDLRGFTAFTESAEPEEVINVLHEYHAEMGRIIAAHEGTIERFIGDGIMVFFNDPVPLANHSENAVRMALRMKERFMSLAESWRLQGFELGIGIGIARGYATIGAIGFEGRWDYSAIGGVTNLAARLCGEAKAAQILADRKALANVESLVEFEPLGELALKGFPQPIAVFNITAPLRGAT